MRLPFNNSYRLSQGFGLRPEVYSQFGMKGHNGLDYATPTGTTILAPHSGRVLEAVKGTTGYGNYVKIENEKEGSLLAHLQSFSVNVGDMVEEGQAIALSNNTGFSSGPHLHWGYYLLPRDRSNGYAGYIDQAGLIGGDNMQEELDKVRNRRDELWNQRSEIAESLGLPHDAPQETIIKSIAGVKGEAKQAREENAVLKQEIENRKEQVSRLEDDVLTYRKERNEARISIENYRNQVAGLSKTIGGLNNDLAKCRAGQAPKGLLNRIRWLFT